MFERLQQQLAFTNELEKLKATHRNNRTLDAYRFENSAEHSWQGALMALVFREYIPEEVNLEKVMSMLLIHDLGEIYAGDTFIFDDVGKSDSYDRELESLKISLEKLPLDQQDSFLELWQEFETGISIEAKYARVLDALVPLLNHLEVAQPHDNPYGLTKSQVIAKKSFIQVTSETLWKLAQEVIDQSVAKGLYLDE
ncbi:HD domain-containing protein [Streptococcus gordonii]|jgi:predicted hydrolase|uniref:Predicted hydrolase n=2 Tax=Streptococcus TaxID=1301 RepID=A8AWX8_STRGC|nr:HD domain-containing protein [Streptococcus gordonii]ABV10381.1 predicted hydrolase [Streptococcus gordonii str. Challis substr. CH1]MBZ2138246.1 HD domain-containing protein [Streptococcus gordonii]QGS43363.1 HD domain-containing protein [Streptococcus gordonii]VEE21189.1 hydrolase [Streptococcus gordonii]VTS79602.1 hydrolase [Streptococcus gordonii]